jgi:hypothetical protein
MARPRRGRAVAPGISRQKELRAMTSRISVAVAALALVLASGAASQAGDYGSAQQDAGTTQDIGAQDTGAQDMSAQDMGTQDMSAQDMGATQPMSPATDYSTTTTVGRSTPSTDMDATMGVPVKTPVIGTWNGIEITPDMVWKAIRQQGMRPLTGFLVRYGDVVVTDAALGDRNVKVAYDPRTNMIREVQ